METNGINQHDQEPAHKKDLKTAFALTGLIALGVVGALGVGFVMGGRGSGRQSDVAGAATTATRTRPVSPTAANQPAASPTSAPQSQLGGQPSGNTNNGGTGGNSGQPPSNGGDVNDDGVVAVPTNTPVPPAPPAPTNTPVPPAPTNTPIPPTSTSVPPTNTPVPPAATATATAIVPLPTFIICIPCLTLVDLTPPALLAGYYEDCLFGTYMTFNVNETSEMWATYRIVGVPLESGHVSGTFFEAWVGGFLNNATDVEFHAVDVWGNAATFVPPSNFCF